MKIRTVALCCLIVAIFLCMGYEHSRAASDAGKASLKIGVISVRKVFRDCKRRKKHEGEMKAREDKINAELTKLKKEIEAAEAGLDILTRESSDYLELERDVSQKRDSYEAQVQFYEKSLALEDRDWTKGFYRDFLGITGEVAEQKGLELVFERSEPDFSMVSAAELLMTIQTHKLLYSSGCVDITDEVMIRLDKEASKANTGGGK